MIKLKERLYQGISHQGLIQEEWKSALALENHGESLIGEATPIRGKLLLQAQFRSFHWNMGKDKGCKLKIFN